MKAIVATSLLAFFGLKEAFTLERTCSIVPSIEKNVEYYGNDINSGGHLGRIKGHLPNSVACWQACTETPGCRSWTFVKGAPAGRDNCAVKRTSPKQGNRKRNAGTDSGGLCVITGKWFEHKGSQCFGLASEVEVHARSYPRDGRRIDNPIFNGGGYIGTLTLRECALRCEKKEGCVGFEWSNTRGLAAPVSDKASCALAWACSYVAAWSGGNAYMLKVPSSAYACAMERNVDYGGNDIDVGGYLGRIKGHLPNAEACQQACAVTPGCKSWTFVKSEPAGRDNCAVKRTTKWQGNRRLNAGCCDSGELCRGDCIWKTWSGWSKCSHTCGSDGTQYRRRSFYPATHGGKRCSGGDRETRSCNRKPCPITKIECSDFEIPNEAELPQFCTDVFVDVITVDDTTTGATEGEVVYKRGTEEEMTRSTTSGFSSEFGWDFSAADRDWGSVTESTEILIKDPSVSIGFDKLSASHSCFNKNSVQCTARNALGGGGFSVGAFFTSGGANILGGLMDMMAGSSGKDDPDKCKCKETKTTVSKEKGQEHTVTVGRMMRQGRTMEQTFERSKKEHKSQEYTMKCPPWSWCAYATYSVTSICAIPYWGTCKATRSDGRVDNFTIERDDTKNLYYTKQTMPKTMTFTGVTEITTDGSICGVMLTPAVDVPEHRHTATCPPPNQISELPNCDCMLPEYNDCGTPDGTLKNGQWCLLNVREGVFDDEICIRSQPYWRNVSSCFSRDVFVVSDYNHPVYARLKAANQLADARPKLFKYTLRGSTGTEVVKVNGAEYVLSKSERAFQNEGPIVKIQFMNNGQEGGWDRDVFLKRTEGSFTLVPGGGSLLRAYNGWNCGTKKENKRCAGLRGGVMEWSGTYEATLSGGASLQADAVALRTVGEARCRDPALYLKTSQQCQTAATSLGLDVNLFNEVKKGDKLGSWGEVCGCSYNPETRTVKWNSFRHPCSCNGKCCPEGEETCEYGDKNKYGKPHMVAQDRDALDWQPICFIGPDRDGSLFLA